MHSLIINTDLEISQKFKENIQEIAEQIKTLDGFTNQLEQKVDDLLQKQEYKFFVSYKIHFKTIEESVQKLEKKISEQESKINQYETQGNVAILIKKTNNLEKQLSQLLNVLSQKDKLLQQKKMEFAICQKQNQRLSRSLKTYIKVNHQEKIKEKAQTLSHEDLENPEGIFTTQLKIDRSPQRYIDTRDQLKELKQKYETQFKKYYFQKKILQQKHYDLNKKYQRLINQNVNNGIKRTQLEQFFINCIEEIKKNICLRNKIPACDLKDFKKEDKMNVLALILSNDDIMQVIFHKIFSNNRQNNPVYDENVKSPVRKGRANKSFNIIPLKDSSSPKQDQVRLPEIIKGKMNAFNLKSISKKNYNP